MFKKNEYENSETYKRIEQEIMDIIGIEDYKRYQKERRNERLKKYAFVAVTTAGVLASAFVVGMKTVKTETSED